MLERVTLRNVIAIVKLSVFFVWFWPLPLHASERKLLFMKLYQLLSVILTIGVIASMLYSLVMNLDDPNLVVKSALGLFPCSHVIWNVLCHLAIYQRLRVTIIRVSFLWSSRVTLDPCNLTFWLQYVIFEMEKFCTLIEPREEAIVRREYVDKYAPFYGFCIASFYTTLFALFVGPVVLDQPFPAQADFPFDASRQPLRAIVYIHQIIVGLLIAAHLSVNALMALLLWLVSARFRLLVEDMRTIADIYDFTKCIEKHQRLLEYDIAAFTLFERLIR